MATLPKLSTTLFLSLAASTYFFGLGAGSAQAVTIDSIDTGWYNSVGFHNPTNNNYFSGNFQVTSIVRSFFVFDLSALVVPPSEAIVSATFSANAESVTNDGQILNLFDYTGDIADLLAGSGGVAAFDDLGSGVNFGSRLFNVSDGSQFASYSLNQNFVNAANSALTGLFVIGARNSNELVTDNYVYGFSGYAPARLDLQFAPVASVPGPLPIAGLAAAFGWSRQSRQRIKRSALANVGTKA